MKIAPKTPDARAVRQPIARVVWQHMKAACQGGGMIVLVFLVLAIKGAASDNDTLRFLAIDTISLDNSHAHAALNSQANRLAVAWDGYVAGRRRIVLRENIAGEWLGEMLADRDSPGENRNPVLSFDELGNLYLAWISHRPAGDVVCLLRRLGEQWLDPIELPSRAGHNGGVCDLLGLAVTHTFPPDVWLTWQESTDYGSSVLAARFDSGRSTAEVWDVAASHGPASPIFSPQLLILHNDPFIVWFTTKHSHFVTMAAQYHAVSNGWTFKISHPLLHAIPANRFPIVTPLNPRDNLLAAAWFEATGLGDRLVLTMEKKDRDFTTTTQLVTFAMPLRGTPQSDPVITTISPTADLLLSFQDRVTSQTYVHLARCDPTQTKEAVVPSMIATMSPSPAGHPSFVLVPVGDSQVVLVYTSARDQGGDGHVYFAQFPMPR
ncbi:MAG: hypothetical protein ACP5UB_03325 [Candidatus Sumerlaeaceae bacterium]